MSVWLTPPGKAAEIALVIDDLGYNLEVGERVLNLPGPVTLSLIPFTPSATALSQLALAAGQDIMLHLPMEALHNNDHDVRHLLELNMPPDIFYQTVISSLNSLPNCIGVNNHTGSLLTQHRQPMEWLMDTIQDRGLFFLDSRTTPNSVANTVAQEWGVPSLKRDVFLDHEQNLAAIEIAFERAIRIAKKKGYAVIIAHPYKSSLAFLEQSIPKLIDESISLVPLRKLIYRSHLLAKNSSGTSNASNDAEINLSINASMEIFHPTMTAPLGISGSAHTKHDL
ncbi:MAG: divergent polysaccharide deacetylase family protein [Pseudomonadales bacterium]|nr:divergent polysaccharide deacetylase family protein [Pseudomonadales bacterium]